MLHPLSEHAEIVFCIDATPVRHPASGKSSNHRDCQVTRQGTGTSNALLVTVVRPSRASIKTELSGGVWRKCQSNSALSHAASRAALTPHAAIKSSKCEAAGSASPRRRTCNVRLANSIMPSRVELSEVHSWNCGVCQQSGVGWSDSDASRALRYKRANCTSSSDSHAGSENVPEATRVSTACVT